MSFRESLTILKERWRVILVVALLLAMGGSVLAGLRSPEYTSTATLYVSAKNDESANAAYQGSLLSEQRVKSYTDLINSDRVLREVRDKLRLNETVERLSQVIEASSELDSVIISVNATDASPDTAALLANAAAESAIRLIDELEAPSVPGQGQPVELRLVQPGLPSVEPSSPSTAALIALTLLGSSILGVCAALAANYFDQSVKDAAQLRQLTHKPVLSEVPLSSPSARALEQNIPDAQFAEAFRRLRVNLQFVGLNSASGCILVTSSVPGDGKTTVSVRLAGALSAAGFRVALVDADMRRASLSSLLGLESAVGLSTIIVGRASVGQAVQRVASLRIDAIAAGQLPPNPSELLSSARMAAVVQELRERYDYVVFDSPPLLPATDGAVLGPLVDGTLLVVRASVTTRAHVDGSAGRLRDVSANVLGTVLNGVAARGDAYVGYAAQDVTASADRQGFTGPGDAAETSEMDSPRSVASPAHPTPHRRNPQGTKP